MSSSENLSSVLRQAIKNQLAELHTCMPAVIVSYDHEKQLASVQPTISRKYADGRVDQYPVINNVPIIFPRSGGASFTMPVKANDPVLLAFTERSMDTWKKTGGVQVQDDPRMHSLSDAVGFVGLSPETAPSQSENNDDVLLDFDGNKVRLKPSGNLEIVCAQSITLICGSSRIEITPTNIHVIADRIDWN